MADELEPEVLAELRARLEATQRAAERLAAEAAQARAEHEEAAAQAPEGPAEPAGWTREDHARRTEELSALLALVQGLRDLIPPEVQDALRELVRELLVLLRSLLDWWLARLDAARGGAPEAVQDVPVTGPSRPDRG